MKPLIKHQTQPCKFSCVTTCLAMLLGEPVETLIPAFHQRYRTGQVTLRGMLEESCIPYTAFYSLDERSASEEGVYLCTVPSINIEGGNHQLLIEVTEDGYFVIDPVMGRDARYYVARGQEDGDRKVALNGFITDAFISRKWLEGKS